MKAKKSFNYQEADKDYVIQLKKKRYWWLLWFLLLLLPLLLLIRFEKDVYIKVSDASGEKAIPEIPVYFSYHDYDLIKSTKKIDLKDSTNKEGLVIFEKLSYSLYSLLFKSNTLATVNASGKCFMADSMQIKFHKLKDKSIRNIQLPPKLTEITFKVIDFDDGEPLADANIKAKSRYYNYEKEWETRTNPNGDVVLTDAPLCGDIEIAAYYEGYDSDTIKNGVEILLPDEDLRKLKLRSKKAMIKFIVRDLKTNDLLPNAQASLKIEGKTVSTSRTNTNGVGVGVFDSIRITAQATVLIQKEFYHDTTATFLVSEFTERDEKGRTFYLRPSKQTISFRDIDSKSRKGIAGVKNMITVNGKTHGEPIYSNSSGVFIISGVFSDDKISITASKSGYKTNSTKIKNATFSNLIVGSQTKRDIPLIKNTPPPPPKDDNFKGEGGDLRINLQWNTYDDLDLYVTDPCGKTIWALALKQRCGGGLGTLDVDANTNRYPKHTWTRNAQENMFWKKPSKGAFKISVKHCNKQDTDRKDPVKFNITVIDDGKRTDYKGSIRYNQKKHVATYTVK